MYRGEYLDLTGRKKQADWYWYWSSGYNFRRTGTGIDLAGTTSGGLVWYWSSGYNFRRTGTDIDLAVTASVVRGTQTTSGSMEEEDGENCFITSFIICIVQPNIIRANISNRLGWAGYVARMGRWEMRTKIQLEKLNGRRYHSEGYLHWVHLTQDRDWWRALVNTVMNLRIP
jgi:hypothetical protein